MYRWMMRMARLAVAVAVVMVMARSGPVEAWVGAGASVGVGGRDDAAEIMAVTVMPMPDARAGGDACPQGARTWVSKKLVKLFAHAIRTGGRVVGDLLVHLDAKAARAFRKHSKQIADQLDRIAEIPDLTVRVVKEKLIYFMRKELKMNPGTAQVIGEAVAGALEVFLL